MKRAALVLMLAALVATPAPAFRTERRSRSPRVMVLHVAESGNAADYVRDRLVRELRARGFDAIDADRTYDDWRRSGRTDSDFCVELVPVQAGERTVAEAGLPLPHGEAEIAVLTAHVSAKLHVYDGATLDVLTSKRLERQRTTVTPVGAAVATRHDVVLARFPIENQKYRQAINEVVLAAVDEIAALQR